MLFNLILGDAHSKQVVEHRLDSGIGQVNLRGGLVPRLRLRVDGDFAWWYNGLGRWLLRC